MATMTVARGLAALRWRAGVLTWLLPIHAAFFVLVESLEAFGGPDAQ